MASILAIDPGPQGSGYVLYANGCVRECDNIDTGELIEMLWSWSPPHPFLAIEMVAHYGTGMPAGQSIFDTCVVIGRMQQAWHDPEGVVLIPRREVKLALCGSATAKDSNVRQALIDRLGPPGRKAAPGPTYGVSKHAWAALGVAVVAEERLKAKAKEAA